MNFSYFHLRRLFIKRKYLFAISKQLVKKKYEQLRKSN